MASPDLSLLDNPQTYAHLDPSGLIGRIDSLSLQCQEAWQNGLAFDLPKSYSHCDNVLIAGMGGSAIGGDLLNDCLYKEQAPPIIVRRDYKLPYHISNKSLVIASSYSGNTEESISACQDALNKGAKVIVLTHARDGALSRLADKARLPKMFVESEGEPRSAIGYCLLMPLAIMQSLKMITSKDQDVLEAIQVLSTVIQRLKSSIPATNNPAKILAGQLFNKLTVIYGAEHLSGASRRWETQINENAKTMAFSGTIPEIHHNAVEGFGSPKGLKNKMAIVLLNAMGLTERTKSRYTITRDLLQSATISNYTVDGIGKGVLAQLLSSVVFGDYTSYYLGILNGFDPSKLHSINLIRTKMELVSHTKASYESNTALY